MTVNPTLERGVERPLERPSKHTNQKNKHLWHTRQEGVKAQPLPFTTCHFATVPPSVARAGVITAREI
jgi:hypothetical protein